MKKILILLAVLITATITIYYLKGNAMNNTNNETYTVIAPNGDEVLFDKETNLIVSKGGRGDSAYLKEKSKMLLDSRQILNSSPYKDYKPSYFNPNPNEYGQTSCRYRSR